MPRLKGCGRRFKGLKHVKKKVPQSKDDPSNPPPSPGQTPTEDNPKDPPHPTKEPNPSINLDSGSNDEECANSNKEGNATTIRKLPSSTQKPLINATPPKNFSTVERAIMNQASHLEIFRSQRAGRRTFQPRQC